MKNIIIVLLFLALMFCLISKKVDNTSNDKIDPVPVITEDECWDKGGQWIFRGDMDAYGTDQSSFECVIEED